VGAIPWRFESSLPHQRFLSKSADVGGFGLRDNARLSESVSECVQAQDDSRIALLDCTHIVAP
jgi:hypothetical protein